MNLYKKKGTKFVLLFYFIVILFIEYYFMININNNNKEESINVNSNDNYSEKISKINDVSKCVVGITNKKEKKDIFLNNNDKNYYGSGMIISKDGYILTNYHVVKNNINSCYVTLKSGNEFTGKIVWMDSDIDVAIIKINSNEKMNYVNIGDSNKIQIGENVYAIGNPIGMEYQRTVTSGIVSGKNRFVEIKNEDNSISYMEDLIQTDAAINNGNSGGPLINEYGNVIGINTLKLDSMDGIGFAIPINIIKGIITKIQQKNEILDVKIGILAYDKNILKAINSNIKLNNGIYIVDVKSDSLANSIGLKKGDIIKKVDGFNIDTISEFREYIYNKNLNDIIKIHLEKNNIEKDIFLKLSIDNKKLKLN